MLRRNGRTERRWRELLRPFGPAQCADHGGVMLLLAQRISPGFAPDFAPVRRNVFFLYR